MNQFNVQPTENDNFIKAAFDFCLPEQVKTPKFLLILLTGYNGDSSTLCEDPQWLAFAREIEAAIIACTFQSGETNLEAKKHYSAAQHGSGAALDRAIEHFASEHPALTKLKLFVYGHSAGGQFAYGYSCHKPERMLGFAAGKGGYYFPEPKEQTYRVPGLLISGAQDQNRRRHALRELFKDHRKQGAPWCLLEDSAGHEQADTLNAVIPFFRGIVQAEKHSWFALNDAHISNDDVSRNPDFAYCPSTEFYQVWQVYGPPSPEVPEV